MNFTKIENKIIRSNDSIKFLAILLYLIFNMNDKFELCTSLNQIAFELNYKLGSKNTNNIQNSIKHDLINMSESNIIKLIPTYGCNDFNDITNNKLFKINLSEYMNKNDNINSNFTILNYSEYQKILSCEKSESKIANMINLFLLIKSYEYTNNSFCIESINGICQDIKISKATFSELSNILITNNLLYSYLIPNDSLNCNIKYAFSTKPHSKTDLYEFLNKIKNF